MNPEFPFTRLRRNRRAEWSRRLVREHEVTVNDLIWPVFVVEGTGQRVPVASMPGVTRYSVDVFVEEARKAVDLGIPAIAIFPVTPQEKKTPDGEESRNPDNLICRAMRAIRDANLSVGLIADVALDPYTTHGQDGLVRDGYVVNDETLAALNLQAVNQAKAKPEWDSVLTQSLPRAIRVTILSRSKKQTNAASKQHVSTLLLDNPSEE